MSQHKEKIVTTPRPEIDPAPQKPKNDYHKDVYGPGDDDYGRNKSFWKEKDKCISCGKETEYLVSTHIDYRKYYVEGAGQLCKDCYFDIYEKRSKH